MQLIAAYLGHLLDVTGGDHANAVATYFLDRDEPTDAAWDLGLRSFVTSVLARVPDFEAPPPPSATTTTTTTAPDSNSHARHGPRGRGRGHATTLRLGADTGPQGTRK